MILPIPTISVKNIENYYKNQVQLFLTYLLALLLVVQSYIDLIIG